MAQSLSRGLGILCAFSETRRELSINELAAELGVSRPTTYRLVKTLEHAGFLQFYPATKRYGIGPTAFAVGNLFLPAALNDAIDRVLDELRTATTHTAQLTVYDRNSMLVIAAKESANLARVVAHVGQRLPLHATSAGKVALAALPEEEVLTTLTQTGLPRRASATITDVAALLVDLAKIRERGYAVARDEYADGLCSVALLVEGTQFTGPHVILVSAPSGQICGPEDENRLVAFLRRGASQLAPIITHQVRYRRSLLG